MLPNPSEQFQSGILHETVGGNHIDRNCTALNQSYGKVFWTAASIILWLWGLILSLKSGDNFGYFFRLHMEVNALAKFSSMNWRWLRNKTCTTFCSGLSHLAMCLNTTPWLQPRSQELDSTALPPPVFHTDLKRCQFAMSSYYAAEIDDISHMHMSWTHTGLPSISVTFFLWASTILYVIQWQISSFSSLCLSLWMVLVIGLGRLCSSHCCNVHVLQISPSSETLMPAATRRLEADAAFTVNSPSLSSSLLCSICHSSLFGRLQSPKQSHQVKICSTDHKQKLVAGW